MTGVDLWQVFLLLVLGSWEPHDLEPLAADTMFEHLGDECIFTAFADLRNARDGWENLLQRWEANTALSALPDLRVGSAHLAGLETGVSSGYMASAMIHPLDLDSASYCADFDPFSFDVSELVVLRGDFGLSQVTAFGTANGFSPYADTTPADVVCFQSGLGGYAMCGIGAGTLIWGSTSRVRNALAALSSGTSLDTPSRARVAELAEHGIHRFFLIEPNAVMSLGASFSGYASVSELFSGTEWALLMSNNDTVYAEIQSTNENVFRRSEVVLDAIGSLAQAMPLLLRGGSGLIFGAAYPGDVTGFSEQVSILAEYREDIMATMAAETAALQWRLDVDPAASRVGLMINEAAGFQLLVRQIILLSYLFVEEQLPQTTAELDSMVRWWEMIWNWATTDF